MACNRQKTVTHHIFLGFDSLELIFRYVGDHISYYNISKNKLLRIIFEEDILWGGMLWSDGSEHGSENGLDASSSALFLASGAFSGLKFSPDPYQNDLHPLSCHF